MSDMRFVQTQGWAHESLHLLGKPISRCKEYHPDEDMVFLASISNNKRCQISTSQGVTGEPYIIHPFAVARVAADSAKPLLVVAAGRTDTRTLGQASTNAAELAATR